MREKRRRFRHARRARRIERRFVAGLKVNPEGKSRCSASGERREQIAERPCPRLVVRRMPAADMDELAELVDVLDRVLQRRLPGGKQNGGQRDACEAEQHV